MRVEEMPVRIRRHLRHAAHDHGWRQLDLAPRLHAVALAHEKAAERHFRAEQRAGEETALEISPRKKHIARLDPGMKR